MTKTMTNDEMTAALDVLTTVHESGRLGYAIARTTQSLRAAADEYLKMRSDLFMQYGTITGTTATVQGKENVEAFQAALGKTGEDAKEVEIWTVPEQIFIGGHLTNDQMEKLFFMLED